MRVIMKGVEYSSLEHIIGIRFTPREVEVLKSMENGEDVLVSGPKGIDRGFMQDIADILKPDKKAEENG